LDSRPNPGGLRERGFVTVQFMTVVALSMLFLALLLNLIAVQYGKGAVRAALDEGIRRGTPGPAGVAECEAGVTEVLAGLLGGPFGDGVSYGCSLARGELSARADAVFVGWFPGMPTMSFRFEAVGVKESEL
jgi:hypothetical protein